MLDYTFILKPDVLVLGVSSTWIRDVWNKRRGNSEDSRLFVSLCLCPLLIILILLPANSLFNSPLIDDNAMSAEFPRESI